jgi:putative ABC transport system permease protein
MWSSLRSAFRSLARDRGFTTLAIILIAVTGGATTAVYAVIDTVMLAPMPFADEERTVVVWTRDPARDTPVVEVALGEIKALHEQSQAFASLGVFGSVNNTLTLENGDGSRERVQMLLIESKAFDAIGIQPALGRTFNARDELASSATTAVISDRFWRSRFGADPNVLGRTLRTPSSDSKRPAESLEIIGVMPPRFDFPRGVDVWVPAAPRLRVGAQPDGQPGDAAWKLRHYKIFFAVGRLRDGVSPARAADELSGILSRVEKDSPNGAPSQAIVTPIENFIVGPAKPVLWTMLAGAGLMLLLACSSVAGLHLFRAAKQDRAIAVQLALGASRAMLVRQALLETTMLAIAGAIGGFGVAWVVVRVLVFAAPMDVPRLAEASATAPSVLLMLALLTAVTSVLSGMWPAVFIRHVDAGRTLTSGARTAMHPRERLLQRLVVGWQIAVAVVLLSGAALFVRSVQHLDRTPLGFDAPGLLAFEVHPSATTHDATDRIIDEIRARAEVLPHVTSTGAVLSRPLSGPIGWDSIPILKGQEGLTPDAPWRKNPRINLLAATPGYFRTIGARVLSGRDFTPQDRDEAQHVVIVSASMAKRFWPGRDPIGAWMLVPSQRTYGPLAAPRWQTVVGVVDDVRYRGVTDLRYDVYLPALQSSLRVTQLLVRTTTSASATASASVAAQTIADIRSIARDIDPLMVFGDIELMSDLVASETAPWRFAMRVLSAFGGLAAVLATVGLIGLVSLSVALRRKELGIRSALGATPGRLRRHVLTEIVWTAVIAASAGTLATLVLGRLLAGLLVQTAPHDPLSIAAAALLTLAAGLIGCLRPAERAAKTDPAAVLRD